MKYPIVDGRTKPMQRKLIRKDGSRNVLEFAPIKLDQLIGEHVLDAVDTYVEKVPRYEDSTDFDGVNCIRFRLDGAVYTAVENPNDGYRSTLDRVFVTLDVKMVNTFPPIRVLASKKQELRRDDEPYHDTLIFVDTVTKLVVLEVGTDDVNDYYPSFVARFHPENMAVNAGVK